MTEQNVDYVGRDDCAHDWQAVARVGHLGMRDLRERAMSAGTDAQMLRRAAKLMQEVASESAVGPPLAEFLLFAAGFAHQPQPYSPTLDHAVTIARAYLKEGR